MEGKFVPGLSVFALGGLLLVWGAGAEKLLIIGSGVAIMLCGLILLNAAVDQKKVGASRPIVYVWTHDRITRVMPQIDFELWHQLRERKRLAEILDEDEKWPDSDILILFEDGPISTPWPVTGTTNQFVEFTRGCDVREAKLHVYHGMALPLPTAWKLIHGADSKPPED